MIISLLLFATAHAQTFQVSPDPVPITIVCPSGSASASGNTYTCPGVIPPPVTNCSSYAQVVRLGTLPLTGQQIDSVGMNGPAVAYGVIQIPNPLPAGWQGKTSQIAVLANGSGTAWRQIYLSRKPCDFTATGAATTQGLTATLNMIYGASSPYAVRVEAGETWYLNVRDQLPYGGPSCSVGVACEFGTRAYPPGR